MEINPLSAFSNTPVQPGYFPRSVRHRDKDISGLIAGGLTIVAAATLTGLWLNSYLKSHESQPQIIQKEMRVPQRYDSDVLRIKLLERDIPGLGKYMI
ncbi:hypothetical protein J4413_04500 [Candidatus Woesearchaeota archaeon]|nr:hypothetical protein [Candidatus Woesearchaeota archaeon]